MALVTATQSIQSGIGNLDLQNGNNYLNTLANKYIVKPKTAMGVGGFVFDYEAEQTVQYSADITDHYLENNDAVQDHIAQRPARIILTGFVGELAQTAPQGIVGALSTVQNKLTALPAYLGKYTPGAIQAIQKGITAAQNTVNTINLGLSKVQNIVSFLPGAAPQKSIQQKKFAQLYGMWKSRQVFTVETPYTYFDSMVIESFSFRQPEETKDWSDITITLKEMRFIDVSSVQADQSKFGGRGAFQRQGAVNQGKTQGTPAPVSALYSLFGFK